MPHVKEGEINPLLDKIQHLIDDYRKEGGEVIISILVDGESLVSSNSQCGGCISHFAGSTMKMLQTLGVAQEVNLKHSEN